MLCDYLQLQDLYIAGIGFDLGGAFLLARGLIMEPRMLTLVSGGYYNTNSYAAVSVARNRLDAITGAGALFLGFTLQLAGYLVSLATAANHGRGWANAAVGAALAATALLIAVGMGELHQRFQIKPTLVAMSYFDGNGDRQEHPRGDQLHPWGTRGLEIPALEGEGRVAYVQRVFGVTDSVVPKTGGGYVPMTDDEES